MHKPHCSLSNSRGANASTQKLKATANILSTQREDVYIDQDEVQPLGHTNYINCLASPPVCCLVSPLQLGFGPIFRRRGTKLENWTRYRISSRFRDPKISESVENHTKVNFRDKDFVIALGEIAARPHVL